MTKIAEMFGDGECECENIVYMVESRIPGWVVVARCQNCGDRPPVSDYFKTYSEAHDVMQDLMSYD